MNLLNKGIRTLCLQNDVEKSYKQIPEIDGLRGLAVIIVLLSHTSNNELLFSSKLNFGYIGKYGVYLFFVLSAYLLSKQMIFAFKQGKSTQLFWKNYALRRVMRIYPLFIISLIYHYFFSIYGVKTVIPSVSLIFEHLILREGLSIFWSIPVEFKYYMLSPFLLTIYHYVFRWKNTYILFSILVLILISLSLHYLLDFSRLSIIRYLTFFLLGTTIALLEPQILHWGNTLQRRNTLDILALGALLIIILTIPSLFSFLFSIEPNFHSYRLYIIYGLLWSIVLSAIILKTRIISWVFSSKFLRVSGIISFSIYLFHRPLLEYILNAYFQNGIKIYAFFAGSYLIAAITYITVEYPTSKVKKINK